MCCIGDVGVLYCYVDLVVRCYFDELLIVLVIGVVWRVVGILNKISVVILVKVFECCVFSIIVVVFFDNKNMRKIIFIR